MIKIENNMIFRDGSKIGWIEGSYIHAKDGAKLGYFDANHIYDASGHRTAYVEGDYLHSESGDKKMPLEKISEQVEGGLIQDIAKCAIYTLL
jgi:hypothetical protein